MLIKLEMEMCLKNLKLTNYQIIFEQIKITLKNGLIDMRGYVVCVYKSIDDANALKNYAVKARVAVEKYNGKFLIRGGKKITTEGEESPRTVVIEFSSFIEAEKFFYSKEYQEAHSILKGVVIRHHQIIEGA